MVKRLAGTNQNTTPLVNVPAPSSAGDAANKEYVDTATAARVLKQGADVTVTVGAGGDYATINAAIKALSERHPTYKNNGLTAEIKLLTGFVMAEQVFARRIDLSWIIITAVDAVVTIDHTAITQELVDEDNIQPAFGAIYDAKLPTIGALFAYASNATAKDGFAAFFNSSVTFMPECGVRNSRNGLKVVYNSSANCYMPGMLQVTNGGDGGVQGVDLRNCAGTALHVAFNSVAGLVRGNFNDAGGYACYIIWNSRADLYMSQAKNAGISGLYCRDGSTANGRGMNVSGAVKNGFHALHNARIDARYTEDTTAGLEGASNCGDIGVLASGSGYIEAVDMIAMNCGNAGVAAIGNSLVNANYANVSGAGQKGVYAHGASIINFDGGIADNVIGSASVWADGASTISARNGSVRNATGTAIKADTSSTIAITGTTLAGSPAPSVAVFNGSAISANGALGGATFNRDTNNYTGQGIITTNGAPKFEQGGWGYLLGDGDTTTLGSVNFTKPFNGPPDDISVTAIGHKSSKPAHIGDFGVGAPTIVAIPYNITATGFSIMLRDVTGANITTTTRVGYSWRAKGSQTA